MDGVLFSIISIMEKRFYRAFFVLATLSMETDMLEMRDLKNSR